MGDAPGALGGAIPRDKALRDCCVSFPKRTILSSASVGIRAGDVTKNAYGSWGVSRSPPHHILFSLVAEANLKILSRGIAPPRQARPPCVEPWTLKSIEFYT
jgi:hypothetical protein